MRHVLILLFISAAGLAQAQQPASESARTEIIKSALARDRGEISVMEPSTRDGGGVYVGYSTGTLLHCRGDATCTEFKGTPNVAVRDIAVSHRGDRDILWIAYPLGGFYQCLSYQCSRFEWDSEPPQ